MFFSELNGVLQFGKSGDFRLLIKAQINLLFELTHENV